MTMQEEALDGTLVATSPVTRERKPLSRGALVRARLRKMPRFWVGASILVFIVLWAFIGPLLYPYDASQRDFLNVGLGPTQLHWFGTNGIGQDIYAQTLVGLQKSLIIGALAGIGATLIAAAVGSVAGYLGGKIDAVIGWLIHLLLVIPSFFILVLLSPLTRGLSWLALTFFLAAFSWMILAQVVRNQTRSLRNRDFVRAARYMGMPTRQILGRHIIPNIASLLIIDATLGVGGAILSETTLSFFGFGIQAPDVSLGTLLAAGQGAAATRPWLFIFPAAILVFTVLSASLVGDALRDAVDPTSGVNRD